jgi:hypothetical protein
MLAKASIHASFSGLRLANLAARAEAGVDGRLRGHDV